MTNLFLELERLRGTLMARGYSNDNVESILRQAEQEIQLKLRERLELAMETLVQSGVQKDSPEFINDLRPSPDAFLMETESGITDFSEPPMPMLDRLLARAAKPMKDGSGVYKVIPVGGESQQKKTPIHANIFDTQKAIMAERHENAVSQYNKIAPKSSAVRFRTATSKQNRATQWVQPEKEKNFTEDIQVVNSMLLEEKSDIIMDVIRSYEDGF